VLSFSQIFCEGQVGKAGFRADLVYTGARYDIFVRTGSSAAVKNIISMDDHFNKSASRSMMVRDRRYAIRHPFAADAECLDLESGTVVSGVTSDLSMGGCFVCTSKPLMLGCRMRLTMRRKEQVVEALSVVRIVKPRIGMGIEFLDIEPKFQPVFERWLEQLRSDR
jgi:hypothetical protein